MSSDPLSLTLVIGRLQPGGAERVLSTMANYWAAKGWPITMISLTHPEEDPYYRLHPAVTLRRLDLSWTSMNVAQRFVHNYRGVMTLRGVFRELRPDAVISFIDMTNVFTIVVSKLAGIPAIVSERVDLAHYSIPWGWSLLRRLTYPFARRIVVQCEAIRYSLPFHVRGRAVVIPNPVQVPSITHIESQSDSIIILGMGRLAPQKGFDLLIRAFAQVVTNAPSAQLQIWGQGPMLAELQALCAQLGVSGKVRFPGLTAEPASVMAQADMFVLSSRFEGFPNVLLEAMAVGLPVIAFDCPSGPRDIVTNERDGLLITPQDVNSLAAAMLRLIGDRALSRRLGKAAADVRLRFSVETVMSRWEKELHAVVRKRPRTSFPEAIPKDPISIQ